MNKDQSTIIKGVAIIMMLFFHLFNRTEVNELCFPLIMIGDKPLVYYLSQACYPVPFFLILSGYGLTYLYRHNTLCISSEFKRLLKLYIHYWLILIVFMPIAIYLYPTMYKYDILHIIGNVTAVRCNYNGEVWFLFPYAMISLTAFPVINYLYQINGKVKILFTILTYAVIFVIVKYISYNISDILIINIIQLQIIYYINLLFFFSLGILLYKLSENNILSPYRKQYISILSIVCLVFIKSFFKITIADGLYALLFIILFLNIPLNKYVAIVFHSLGRHSMPMWMTHTFFCAYLFPDFIYGFKYPLLIFIVLVLISYLSAIPIMWIGKRIINCMKI